jgi:hypothetical protein
MSDDIKMQAALMNLEEGRITVRIGETFQFDGPVLDYRYLITYSKIVAEILKMKLPAPVKLLHDFETEAKQEDSRA